MRPESEAGQSPAHDLPVPPERTAEPRRRRHIGLRLLVASVVVGICLLASVLTGAYWAAGDARGTAWLLNRLNRLGVGVEVLDPRGSLAGDFEARQVTLKAGRTMVVLDSPRWQGLRLTRASDPAAWAMLHARTLEAERVVVSFIGPPSNKPTTLPSQLQLPLEIRVDAARIGELRVPGLPNAPITELHAQIHMGADRGQQHRFDALSGRFESLRLEGHARLGARSPMVLDVAVQARQQPATPKLASAPPPPWSSVLREGWQAQLRAGGPLARFDLEASLTAKGQQLDAQAQVEPASRWPLPHLSAKTVDFDLSALLAQAPATALTGQIGITPAQTSTGADAGFKLVGEFINTRPGAWNDRLLPLRQVKVDLRSRPGAPGFDLAGFEALLAGADQDAGTLRGSGQWEASAFDLKAELAQVKPGALDLRLPAMMLSGPVTLSGRTAVAAAPASGASAPRPTFKAAAQLKGRMTQFDRAVELQLDASGDERRIDVHEFKAAAGGAQATLSGSARQEPAAGGDWQVDAKMALADFDPVPWFPGAAHAAWAAGPHRLNLKADLGLRLPGEPKRPASSKSAHSQQAFIDRLAKTRGQASVELTPSILAGEAVSGQLSLRRASASEALQAVAALDLGGNNVKLDASLAASETRGAQDRWALEVRAPAIGRLAPLLRLLPKAQASGLLEGLSGALSADAQATGRWPDLAMHGKVDLASLKAGPLTLAQGELRARLGSAAEAPLDIQLNLAQADWGSQRLGGTQLQVKGTPTSHELNLRTELNASPPAWLAATQRPGAARPPTALDAPARTRAVLSLQGGLSGHHLTASGHETEPWGWKGSVRQLDIRDAQPGASPWIASRNFGIEWRGGEQPQLAVTSGRADLFDAGLKWERIEWRPEQGLITQALDIQAELEPLNVAPLLKRLQPDFGWGGDLKIGGHIVIKQAADFQADVHLERRGGDLNVTDDSGTQALGLTDLVLSLKAQDGIWNFTQGLAGKQLGVAAGAQVIRTSAQRAWPEAQAPLQGIFESQVDHLGAWGSWVPTGWRLGGQLRTTASLAGRFGAPEYTGHVEGHGITVRNVLQGVNVTQGEIDIALDGDTAHINNFTARAGDGNLRLTGNARLGAHPQADLQLMADKFQLLGRVDRRIVASGQGQVALEKDRLKIEGKFGIDEGMFDFTRADAPTLGSDVIVTGRTDNPADDAVAALPVASESSRNTTLDLQIDLGKNLRLRGRGIDTGLQGQMKISTPGGTPSWNGSIRAVGGTYAAYGQKLVIERGAITFNGPVADPRLDIRAARPDLDVQVGVAISGSAQNPRVRLYSEPEMSDIDKLSWLMLGRASEGLGTSDTALLQRAALALLAGDNPGVTDQVLQSIGLDDVSVRQQSEGDVKETVVSLGKQLSRRWYLGYERGLNTTSGTFQLIYRIAQRFTLRTQAGLDNSLDVIWTWKWH